MQRVVVGRTWIAPETISSGAVSPATRAMPRISDGGQAGRARSAAPPGGPSATARRRARGWPRAARSGTTRSTTSADRAMIGDHRDGQRQRGGEAAAVPAASSMISSGVDEQAGQDVGQRRHRLDDGAHQSGEPAADLGEEHRGADAERQRDQHRDRRPRSPCRRWRGRCRPGSAGRSAGPRSCRGCRSSGGAAPASPCRRCDRVIASSDSPTSSAPLVTTPPTSRSTTIGSGFDDRADAGVEAEEADPDADRRSRRVRSTAACVVDHPDQGQRADRLPDSEARRRRPAVR